MNVGFPIFALIIVLAVVFVVRQRDPAKRARILKRAGFGVSAFFAAFFGLFVIGSAFEDPGGWEALGLVAAWAVPLAAIAAVAWFRPNWATPLFAVLIAALIGMSIWFALNPQGWRALEDRNGPIRDIITFVVAAAVALLGLKRTAVAGVMLLVLGIVPLAITSLGSLWGFATLAIATSAPVLTGVLYLLSARMTGRLVSPGDAEAGPKDQPKAA